MAIRNLPAWMAFALVLLVAFAVTAPTTAAAQEAKVVTNPAKPSGKSIKVPMEELWRLGGDTDDEDEFFGVISDIKIDKSGNVYLLDSQLAEVKIYNADGEYLRSIGREGEGPGEFRYPIAMFFANDGNVAVLQAAPGKIVLLTNEGDPAGEMPLPPTDDGGWQMLNGGKSNGGNVVLMVSRQAFDQEANRWSRGTFLASVGEDGAIKAEYTDKENVIDMAAPRMFDKEWDTFERRWDVAPDGRVYAATSYDDYAIQVWKADGTPDRVIKREYTKQKRTELNRKRMEGIMGHYAKMMPNSEVKIETNAKDVEAFYIREDGSLWVLTSWGLQNRPDGTLGVFDVFNPQGKFTSQVTLAGQGDPESDAYFFVKNRVYVVTSFLQAAMSAQGVDGAFDDEEEPEPMAVICYKLDGDELSMSQ